MRVSLTNPGDGARAAVGARPQSGIHRAPAIVHRSFPSDAQETYDQKLFALDNGVWDIPDLRTLERLLDRRDGRSFPLVQEFPRSASATACPQVPGTGDAYALILLSIEDVTERRAIEAEKSGCRTATTSETERDAAGGNAASHRQQFADHCQYPHAQGPRGYLGKGPPASAKDAHRRVMSVAAVQEHLHGSGRAGP